MRNTNKKTLIIAEIGQAHDGSLGFAHSFIDAVSKTKADAVKFQTHIASAETTIHEPWRINFSKQDKSRYDYWKRMEFSKEEWIGLKSHAKEKGLEFLSSPFSLEAVEILKEVGVHAWKIASGEVNNNEILDSIAETKLEIFLSTGMSKIEEIDSAVNKIEAKGLDYTILQCTSIYPTPKEKIGLNLINFYRERYGCNVGLSDHSGTIYAGLAAATIGINVLEVHVTFSKDMFGPDVSSSITIDNLSRLVEGVRFIEAVQKNDVEKDDIAEELTQMRRIFRKSIIYKKDIKKGSMVNRKDLAFKKPGTGVSPENIDKVLGKKLNKSVKADDILSMDDF